jgi:hypothetical protein
MKLADRQLLNKYPSHLGGNNKLAVGLAMIRRQLGQKTC